MKRFPVLGAAILLLLAAAAPALAGGQCYITGAGAFCDGRDYVLHATWTDNQGCYATFDYYYRCCTGGAWQSIATGQGQTLVWHPTAPSTCPTAGYEFKIVINCESPCTCNAPPGYWCEYEIKCIACGP